ncbi:heptaprenyl diphosphate synthase [Clostridiales Family XIII bacterium PM5-7]
MQSQSNKSVLHTKWLALSSMFAALALIFSYVEAIIPFSIGIPGVKLGLANLVIIIALYQMNFRYAMTINMVRIFVAGLLFNGLFGALYSLAGGMVSLVVMWALKRTGLFSMIGVSMAGGVAHNFGQLLVASYIVSNLRMFLFFPILLISGMVSGILIGIVAYVINQKVPKSLFQ